MRGTRAPPRLVEPVSYPVSSLRDLSAAASFGWSKGQIRVERCGPKIFPLARHFSRRYYLGVGFPSGTHRHLFLKIDGFIGAVCSHGRPWSWRACHPGARMPVALVSTSTCRCRRARRGSPFRVVQALSPGSCVFQSVCAETSFLFSPANDCRIWRAAFWARSHSADGNFSLGRAESGSSAHRYRPVMGSGADLTRRPPG
jgi:hypothetical protein